MCRKLLTGAALLIVSLLAADAPAQQNLLGELYGLGVHAYHAGDYRDAYANLSAAVESGSRDPRVYYFRGLSLTNLGRAEEAREDFDKGAQLEVAGGGEQYPIGKSLERVQGLQRLSLERVRKFARIRHQQEELAKSKEYYEQRTVVQEPTLGNQPDPATTANSVEELVDPAEAVEGGDPFGEEGGLGVGAAEVAPETGAADVAGDSAPAGGDPFGTETEPAQPAAGDPFGTETEPAQPAGGDPFGTDPAPPAGGDPFGAEPEPEGEPALPGDDPFGAEPVEPEPALPAGGDPFGAEPEPEGEPALPGDDPFGAEPEPEAPAPAAGGPFGGTQPAPEGDDPFAAGEDDPAGADDPFGADPEMKKDSDPFGDDNADADPLGPPATPADAPAENPASDDPFADPG